MSCPEDSTNCTFSTCPKECAQIEYAPTVPGNITYLAVFAVILLAHAVLGIRYRTWGFLVGMVCGLVLEIIGYAGRVMLHDNPFDQNPFIIYLVCLTIGPAFLSGAIYLCLSRIVVAYGAHLSRFSPRTLSVTFMVSDFISLVLQAAGGAIAATGNDQASNDTGRNIMVAGLAWQVASLILYMLAWADFIRRLARAKRTGELAGSSSPRFRELRARRRFKLFQYALWGSTILILIRSIYRVVELQGGFNGAIANNEAAFMVFEGPMIIVATALLVVWHPGYAFGGEWAAAAWSLRGRKHDALLQEEEKEMGSASSQDRR